MIITRGFSLTNFVIGGSALVFQVFVLYPWHHKLDQDFEALKAEHVELRAENLRVLREGETARTMELKSIREQLQALHIQKTLN